MITFKQQLKLQSNILSQSIYEYEYFMERLLSENVCARKVCKIDEGMKKEECEAIILATQKSVELAGTNMVESVDNIIEIMGKLGMEYTDKMDIKRQVEYARYIIFVKYSEEDIRIDAFNEYRKSGRNCDVWIVVDGMKIPVHKAILSTKSLYFKTMFNSDMMEANMEEISISGIDHQTMELVIGDMYGARIKLTDDNAQSVLLAANYMQITDLVDRCAKFIVSQIDISNCVAMRQFLKSTNCDKELIEMTDYYINAYFVPLSKHESFVQLDIDDVTQLLSSDNLYIDNEIDVYQAAIRWLNEKKERKEYVDRVLKCIRSNLISPYDLSIADETSVKKPRLESSTISPLPSSLPPRECQSVPSSLVQLFSTQNRSTSILEAYNPSTKQWNKLGTYPIYPSNSIIVYHKRQLYIIGTIFTKTHSSSFGRFDLDTGIYTALQWPKQILSANNSSAVIVDNKLYVMNCHDEERPFMEIYDIDTDTWSSGPATNEERYKYSIAAVGKYIYAFGGLLGGRSSTSVERLDTETMTWEYVAPMIYARRSTKSVAYRGKIYVIGGVISNAFQVYDPVTDQWDELASIRKHSEDTVLVANFDGIYAMRKRVELIEYYNVEKDEWSSEKITTPLSTEQLSPVFAIPINAHEL